MKNPISSTTIIATVSVVVLVVIVAAVMYFRSDAATGGPALTPKSWSPPGQWAGAPGAKGATPTEAPQ
jgi:hypothetical protein